MCMVKKTRVLKPIISTCVYTRSVQIQIVKWYQTDRMPTAPRTAILPFFRGLRAFLARVLLITIPNFLEMRIFSYISIASFLG